jgi:predicted membrane channel-forming protein YqfA (hemolysin III family)
VSSVDDNYIIHTEVLYIDLKKGAILMFRVFLFVILATIIIIAAFIVFKITEAPKICYLIIGVLYLVSIIFAISVMPTILASKQLVDAAMYKLEIDNH